MRQAISNHKWAAALGAIAAALVAAYLAFGFFGVQAAFTNTTVSESQPLASESSATQTLRGTFAGADAAHDVAGTAVVVTDGERRFVRFENFKATNGPDLFVYLRADNGEFVSLGALKGNIGDQNYEVPADVDLATYATVQVWCDRFSVSFGSARLA